MLAEPPTRASAAVVGTQKQQEAPPQRVVSELTALATCQMQSLDFVGGWKRLARIYLAAKPGSAVRKAINAEARRCGYTPRTIIALHAE